jgi:Nif-specific regulatory protein/two-component system response regulator HydG
MPTSPQRFTPQELELLYRIAQTLLTERDYGELLSTLLEETVAALGADRGFVLIREEGTLQVSAASNFPADSLHRVEAAVSTSIADAVLEEGKALLIGDALASPRFGNKESVRGLGLRSVLCAPLVTSNEAFALIYLENRSIRDRFGERQRELLDAICALAAPRLRTAVGMRLAQHRARLLESALGPTDGLLTADSTMAAVLESVRQFAPTDLPVLIEGETGTGKELVARALYRHSRRANGPFVVLNCAAIPGTLIESELFGYVRGAFTGAQRDRTGLIGAAHRGTLFLDEIGELPADLQPRLLRVLQSGEFLRLGSTQTETADVRFLAATNRHLEREVEEGRFRSDLYYRLSAVTLKLPPLRQRPHDIHLLAEHLVRAHASRYGRQPPRLSDEALTLLAAYPFPGNVRELENEIARLVTLTPPGGVIPASALSDRIRGLRPEARPAGLPPMPLAEMEKRLIVSVLEHTGGNRSRAAEVLGISREGLRTKMHRLRISAREGEARESE